jgi:hypothetical protein
MQFNTYQYKPILTNTDQYGVSRLVCIEYKQLVLACIEVKIQTNTNVYMKRRFPAQLWRRRRRCIVATTIATSLIVAAVPHYCQECCIHSSLLVGFLPGRRPPTSVGFVLAGLRSRCIQESPRAACISSEAAVSPQVATAASLQRRQWRHCFVAAPASDMDDVDVLHPLD